MKQFNLEEYLENPDRKIVTRDGRPVKIICTDSKFEFLNAQYPVMALIKDFNNDNNERSFNFTSGGKKIRGFDDNTDLFFVPIKKEGWVSVYKTKLGYIYLSEVFGSKEEAEDMAEQYNYVTTTKIEWEE